jgi:type II secretory pathway pseudopilin PulG
MVYRLTNQKGFAAVETVLVIVILAIVGSTGYYVYHANQKTDAALNAASKAAASETAKADGGKGGGGDSHAQTGPAKNEVFIINEWNVSAEIPRPPENAALIQYKITDGQPAAAQFTTQELIDAGGSDCGADHEPAGMIVRAKTGNTFYLGDGTSSGKTVAQELATGTFKPYKHLGDYYYWYVHAQAGCGDVAKTGPLQTLATGEVKQIVTHLQQD